MLLEGLDMQTRVLWQFHNKGDLADR